MRVPAIASSVVQWIRLFVAHQGEQSFELVDAGGLDYAPATPANWPNVPPITVGQAIDGLAQPAAQTQTSGALSANATILFDTTAIAPLKSGNYQLTAFGTVQNSSAGTNLLWRLRIDGAAVAPFAITTAGIVSAENAWSMSQIVTVTTTSTHTFGFQCAAATGTVSAAAGQPFSVSVVELGG